MTKNRSKGRGKTRAGLGYLGHSEWRDMSDYVVHFTSDFKTLEKIVSTRTVNATGPFGWLSGHDNPPGQQCSACFSEVPLEYLERLASRHGQFGLAFRKQFVLDHGGARVWYLDRDHEPANSLFKLARSAYPKPQNPDDPLLRLTPFIDCRQTAIAGRRRYEFEWEREWRVPGGLSFRKRSIAFFLAPKKQHKKVQKLGRKGDALVLDSTWNGEKLQARLRELTA